MLRRRWEDWNYRWEGPKLQPLYIAQNTLRLPPAIGRASPSPQSTNACCLPGEALQTGRHIHSIDEAAEPVLGESGGTDQ